MKQRNTHIIVKFKTLLFIFILVNLHPCLSAQDELNKDVKVIREYTPTVSDARKIEQMPELDDTTSYHPVFKYSILSSAFDTENSLEPISPAKMAKEKPGLLSNSYTRFGIGTESSFLGELYYNLLQSDNYALGLSFGHESSFGKVTLANDEEVETPYHDTYSNLYFKSVFDKVILKSGLDFKHDIYKYYGYQTLQRNRNYNYLGETISYTGSELTLSDRQRTSSFNLTLGLEGRETKITETQWLTNINYLTFGTKSGAKHNQFAFIGTLHAPSKTLFFDLDFQVISSATTFTDSIGPMLRIEDQKNTSIIALPRIGLQYNLGYAEAGLFMATSPGSNNNDFNIAPHLKGNLTIAEGIVSIFAGFTGKYNINDYASIYKENPYISPDVIVPASFYGIDIHGGITGNFSTTTSFTARFDYNYFNDEHFFINKYYQLSGTAIDSFDYTNNFDVVLDNGSLLKVQGELLVNPNEDVNLRLTATYNGWNLKNEEYAWHKPETEIGLWGKFQLNESLSVNSTITLLGKRYAYIPGDSPLKLDPVFDLNLGAEYQLNKSWNFWTEINNGAFIKYYRWNGYPSYGFRLMVGAAYKF